MNQLGGEPMEFVVDNGKQKIYACGVEYSLQFLRPVPDPQMNGNLKLPKDLAKTVQKQRCIFCKEKNCQFFLLRDSFYDITKRYWDLYSSCNEKDTIFEIAAWKGDIFMGATLEQLDPNQNKDYTKFTEWFRETYYDPILDDYFQQTLFKQLYHEKLVQKVFSERNYEPITIYGKEYKLTEESFKINYDFDVLNQHCMVCDNGKMCKARLPYNQLCMKLMYHRLMKQNGAKFPPNFCDYDQMMHENNWTMVSLTPNIWEFNYKGAKARMIN
jgi:hypothetical protein